MTIACEAQRINGVENAPYYMCVGFLDPVAAGRSALGRAPARRRAMAFAPRRLGAALRANALTRPGTGEIRMAHEAAPLPAEIIDRGLRIGPALVTALCDGSCHEWNIGCGDEESKEMPPFRAIFMFGTFANS